ncbi:uncharacterized protein LOC143424452 [Xylocopa sonorina]|uniref:uncharacterized protein LOC143424452 n=1 Tax=Xylocopa sonorina TaxID=1818115 RepID=UPI00403B17D0
MKLRTFRVLCYLCILCTCSALSVEIGRENQPVLDVKSSSSDQEQEEPLDPNNPRDKRALGLILSGLAQVFGYTVDPIQIGSLPNPSPPSNGARASGNNNQTATNSTQSSSSTAAPRQRETIRFTGLVNLGNGTGLLTQLEQYERLFHGNGSLSSTTVQPPTTTSTMPPQTTPSQPLEPRLLVKIPVPNVSLPPLPAMPQPPLPEIPSQDIVLSYPQPLVTPRNQQQLTFRITETTDRLTVENKEIYDPKDVQSPPPPIQVPYTAEPPWKKEYEQRLAELERRQEEHAHRLKQQEWHRNRQKDNNRSGEEGHGGPKKQSERVNRPSKCRKHGQTVKNREPSEVEDLSRETYESEERAPEQSERTRKPEESEEEEEEEDRERYKAHQANENYTNVQYSEPLPLSEDDEQRRPEELRNSYGEPLHNRELYDDGGYVNYFGKFKQPLSDYYSSSAPSNSREDTSQNTKEESHDDREDEEESSESSREEEDIPARNKYEEYNLEEEDEPNRRNERVSEEDSSEDPKTVSMKEKNRSYFQEKNTTEEMDYTKNMPLVVPVRYLSAPEELRKAKSRLSTAKRWEGDNNVAKTETTKKIAAKETRRPKKENLKAVAAFPGRQTPKKLHEGEQKVLQMWPPPFDFVVDSTVHTNVLPVTPPSINNSKERGNRRKPESSDKGKGNKQQQQRRRSRVNLNNTTQRSRDNSEDTYRQDSKANSQYERAPEEQKMISRPADSKKIHVDEIVSDPNDSKDSWDRYKYTSNDNYRNTERPKFETLKRSIEAPEYPVGNYYSEAYPAENKQQVNVKDPGLQNVQVIRQESGTTAAYDPRGGYDFFDFSKNIYGLDYGKESARMSGVFEGDKKVGNEETVGITVPQRDVYRYDESLTKFTSEPESKSEKVGVADYTNGATAIRMVEQEQIPNAPIGYIDYSRLL